MATAGQASAAADTRGPSGVIENGSVDLREFCSFHEQYVSRNIQLADAKAGVTLVAFAGIIALTLKDDGFRSILRSAIEFTLPAGNMISPSMMLAVGATALNVFGVAASFGVLAPRQWKTSVTRGLVFWGDVAEIASGEDYARQIRLAGDEGLARERLTHSIDISKVCAAKMRLLRHAMHAGGIGIVLSTIWMVLFGSKF